MKAKKIDAALVRKLKFVRHENSRHIHYVADSPGGPISLPSLVCLSRGNGDVTDRNRGSVARALGLREQEFSHMVECTIGRRCTLIALAIHLLNFVYLRYAQEGAVFRPGLVAMVQSVEFLLQDLPPAASPTKPEAHLMERCCKELALLLPHPELGVVSRRIFDMLIVHANSA